MNSLEQISGKRLMARADELARHSELAGGLTVAEADALHTAIGAATWRDYLVLTKPRVIELRRTLRQCGV